MIDKETKNWIIKALNDSKTAQKPINLPKNEIITDTLCFHCQQTVEKLLKAFLVYHKIGFQKVHTIEYLLKLCSTINKEFESLYEKTKNLMDYVIDIRYTNDFYIPTI